MQKTKYSDDYFKRNTGIMIRDIMTTKYKELATKYSILLCRDFAPKQNNQTLYKKFIDIIQRENVGEQQGSLPHLETIQTDQFYKFLRNVHSVVKQFQNANKAIEGQEFKICDIIFIEIGPFLTHYVEYSLLLYMYLLNVGIALPRLFVVLDYYSTDYDFITTNIFRNQVQASNIPIARGINYIEQYKFNQHSYIDKIARTKNHIIFSQFDDIFEKQIKKHLIAHNKNYKLFNGADMESILKKSDKDKDMNIILTNDIDDILNFEGEIELIFIDPTVRVPHSAFYSGNKAKREAMNINYVEGLINKIRAVKGEKIDFAIYYTADIKTEPTTRGVLTRSFETDVLELAKSGCNLACLYQRFFKDNSTFNPWRTRIGKAFQQLDRLGLIVNGIPKKGYTEPLDFRIHPVLYKIISLWKSENLPLFPILVFVAVITTYENFNKEVKEHGIREIGASFKDTSRYGQAMDEYLELMNQSQYAIMSEGGKTATVLKHLTEVAKLSEEQFGIFDLDEFTIRLAKLLTAHFEHELLYKTDDGYIKLKNPNRIWKSNDSYPKYPKIFPITTFLKTTYVQVTLYVPVP